MARKTEPMLTLGNAVTASLRVVDKKKLTFTAKVGSDDVCDFTGKVKRFRDADTLINALLKASPSIDTITLEVDTEGVRVPKIPTDPVAAATAEKQRLTNTKTAVTVTRNKLVSQLAAIAAYANGNATQQAYLAEVQAQKDAVDAIIADLDAKIAVQDSIITPTP